MPPANRNAATSNASEATPASGSTRIAIPSTKVTIQDAEAFLAADMDGVGDFASSAEDQQPREHQLWNPKRRNPLAVASAALEVGALSGFFGIGGGFLIVPGLLFSTGMPMICAIGSPLLAVGAFGLTTAVSHGMSGLIDWPVAAEYLAGGLVGGFAGMALAISFAPRKAALNRVFTSLVFIVAILLLGAMGATAVCGSSTIADAAASESSSAPADDLLHDPNSPVLGNPPGAVTVIEFFDYSCPIAGSWSHGSGNLLAQDKSVRLVLKDWSIFGGMSVYAAQVAIASGWQGKYAQVHDALFTLPTTMDRDAARKVARKASVDLARLDRDLSVSASPVSWFRWSAMATG